MARKIPSGRFPLGIGALSARTGCNIETIRYYEKTGLLPAPPRSPGGHRLYQAEHLKRLAFILRCRQLGFRPAEIRTMLGLAESEAPGCAEVQSVTASHLRDLRGRIAHLRKLERRLARMVNACSTARAPSCPVLDELFQST
jgi:MerR family mercuric resistance operon transcriptional regulator